MYGQFVEQKYTLSEQYFINQSDQNAQEDNLQLGFRLTPYKRHNQILLHSYNQEFDTMLLILSDGSLVHYDFQTQIISKRYDNFFGLQINQIQPVQRNHSYKKNTKITQKGYEQAYLVLTDKQIGLLTLCNFQIQSRQACIQKNNIKIQIEKQLNQNIAKNTFMYDVKGKSLLDYIELPQSQLNKIVSRKFVKSAKYNPKIFVQTDTNKLKSFRQFENRSYFVISVFTQFVYLVKYSIVEKAKVQADIKQDQSLDCFQNQFDNPFNKIEFCSLKLASTNFKSYKILLSPLIINQTNSFKRHMQQSQKHIKTSILTHLTQKNIPFNVKAGYEYEYEYQQSNKGQTVQYQFSFVSCSLNQEFQQTDLRHRIFTINIQESSALNALKIENQRANINKVDKVNNKQQKIDTKIMNSSISQDQNNNQTSLYFIGQAHYFPKKSKHHVIKQYFQINNQASEQHKANQSKSSLVYVVYQVNNCIQIQILFKNGHHQTFQLTSIKCIRSQNTVLASFCDVKLHKNCSYLVALCYNNSAPQTTFSQEQMSIINVNRQFSSYGKYQIKLIDIDIDNKNSSPQIKQNALCSFNFGQRCSIFIKRRKQNQYFIKSFDSVGQCSWKKLNLIQKKAIYSKILQGVDKNLSELAVSNILSLL